MCQQRKNGLPHGTHCQSARGLYHLFRCEPFSKIITIIYKENKFKIPKLPKPRNFGNHVFNSTNIYGKCSVRRESLARYFSQHLPIIIYRLFAVFVYAITTTVVPTDLLAGCDHIFIYRERMVNKK